MAKKWKTTVNHWSRGPDAERIKKQISEAKKKNPTKYWLGKHLSPEHNKKLQDGKKNSKYPHNWKGGMTPLVLLIRYHPKSHQWRSDIFIRDDYTCQLCGKRGCYIEADHYPKSFAYIFHKNSIKSLKQALVCDDFWDLDNGRTLCKPCHDKTKHNEERKRLNSYAKRA